MVHRLHEDVFEGQTEERVSESSDMPEDMKELFRQRQRELAAERAEFAADAAKKTDENALPTHYDH
jgi:hypothetical protein